MLFDEVQVLLEWNTKCGGLLREIRAFREIRDSAPIRAFREIRVLREIRDSAPLRVLREIRDSVG